MNILDFTVEEINIVAMYKTDTRKATWARIGYAMPYMSQEMRGIAQSASRKLLMLSKLCL